MIYQQLPISLEPRYIKTLAHLSPCCMAIKNISIWTTSINCIGAEIDYFSEIIVYYPTPYYGKRGANGAMEAAMVHLDGWRRRGTGVLCTHNVQECRKQCTVARIGGLQARLCTLLGPQTTSLSCWSHATHSHSGLAARIVGTKDLATKPLV
ncbi:hypothetical protein C8R45DRAFT_161239 [Mycena sanguinolenta]|nr:hypothetical protein C8R45DRAFT_161239 [Mycena sanguinolenta]